MAESDLACLQWECSACTYTNKLGKFCQMYGTPNSKHFLAASTPLPPVVNVPPLAHPKKAKTDDEVHHPTSIMVESIGMEMGDQGRSCLEHIINCGEVMAEDVVVCLQKWRL